MSQEDFQQLVLRKFDELEADIKEVKIISEAYQKASTQVLTSIDFLTMGKERIELS